MLLILPAVRSVHAQVATFGSQNTAPSAAVPLCTPDQLSLATDDENGSFDGMSHSGTLLVLRNLGSGACRVPSIPQITLSDAKGPLNVKFSVTGSRFMHPGPAMLPVVVAAGAELTSSLRWVSGDAYGNGVCVNATALHIQVAGRDVSTPWNKQLCGDKIKGIQAEMTALRPDPVYKPATK